MAKVDVKAGSSKFRDFFKGVQAQFNKIIWPTKETMLKQLAAVLVVSIVVGLLIVLIDYGAQELIDFLMGIKLS